MLGGGGGGEAAIPLQLGREGGGASDIFVVLGVWTLDRASGVGAATWVSCQLWWRALLDGRQMVLVTPLQPK